jgi:hypothetical protein
VAKHTRSCRGWVIAKVVHTVLFCTAVVCSEYADVVALNAVLQLFTWMTTKSRSAIAGKEVALPALCPCANVNGVKLPAIPTSGEKTGRLTTVSRTLVTKVQMPPLTLTHVFHMPGSRLSCNSTVGCGTRGGSGGHSLQVFGHNVRIDATVEQRETIEAQLAWALSAHAGGGGAGAAAIRYTSVLFRDFGPTIASHDGARVQAMDSPIWRVMLMCCGD